MRAAEKYLSMITAEEAIFWPVVLTFLLLPTGTAPPLIGLGLACAAWLFSGRCVRAVSMLSQAWFWPVILFVLLPWIGLGYSLNMDLGLDYAMKTKYWIALLVTATLFLDDKRVHILVTALWAGLLMGSLLAMVQVAGLAPVLRKGFPGFGIVHTLVSMYLIVGILMAAFYFKRARTMKYKALMLVLILAFIFHLSILEGRSGYLVFALLSPLVARDLVSRFSLKIKIAVSIVLVLCLALSPVVRNKLIYTFQTLSENRVKALQGQDIQRMPRFFIMGQALEVMHKHPLRGIGTGSLTEPTRANGHEISHPHNNFLYMGTSFGIIGFFSCAWLFWSMFKTGWQNRNKPLGYFVLSTCLVLFLGGMFDTQLLNTGTLLMFSMTYGFLGHLTRDSGKEPRV